MQGEKSPPQPLSTEPRAFSAGQSLGSSAGQPRRYLLCSSSSSSLEWEEPREKRVLDLRRSGEMLTEKEIRRAGCGCGCAEEWLTGDVRIGTSDPHTQSNVTGLWGSCLGKRCNLSRVRLHF